MGNVVLGRNAAGGEGWGVDELLKGGDGQCFGERE